MSKTTTKLTDVDTFALSRGYGQKSHAKRAMIVFAGTHVLSPDEFELKHVDGLYHFKRLPLTQSPELKAMLEASVAASQAHVDAICDRAEAVDRRSPADQGIAAVKADDAARDAAHAELPRGVTSPAPKKVDCEIKAAIDLFKLELPANLVVTPEEAARRKEYWKNNPPKSSSRTSPHKPKTQQTEQELEMARQISAANKKQGRPVKETSKRYDWVAAELKAKAGTIPSAPDMSAPTHRYYVGKQAELTKLAKAGDLKGLQKYDLGEREDGSPLLLKKYRAVLVTALKNKR